MFVVTWLIVLLLCFAAPGFCGSTLSPEAKQLFDQGVKYTLAKQPREAASVLEQAENLAPDDYRIQMLLGAAYHNTKRYTQAIEHYKRAMELNSSDSRCALDLAHCYMNLNRPGEAVPWFERYLQDNPDAKDAAQVEKEKNEAFLSGYVTDGDRSMEAKNWAEAKRQYEYAASIQPDSSLMHFKLGAAAAMSNDLPRAIGEYQWAYSLEPKYIDALFSIASCYQMMGQLRDAIDWYQRYIDVSGNPLSDKSKKAKAYIDQIKQRELSNEDDPHHGTYLSSVSINGKPCRWQRSKMPIKVYIDNPSELRGYRSEYRRQFLSGLDEWARASDYRLHFITVSSRENADVTVDWTNEVSAINPTNARDIEQGSTEMFIGKLGNGDYIVGKAHIRILLRYKKRDQELSTSEVRNVCLHEIGHMLGMRGHSTNNEDIMFFCENPSGSGSLSDRDRRTILELYDSYPSGSAPASSWDTEY
jgi:tetratricopeptide (TPR) repeat protein